MPARPPLEAPAPPAASDGAAVVPEHALRLKASTTAVTAASAAVTWILMPCPSKVFHKAWSQGYCKRARLRMIKKQQEDFDHSLIPVHPICRCSSHGFERNRNMQTSTE